jgi:1,4-alpha-glucan branching enzyme
MFQARLVLAATLSSSYGIYGPVYELGEARRANREARSTSTRRSTSSVIYEVHVRGVLRLQRRRHRRLRGLTEKLDYLQWLGVDCLWLLPFYPSPLRDGGYDIADYTDVHPDYGTLDDFKRFLDEAHRAASG